MGRRFLDVGSGTGIISLFAADNGAAEIVAIDINNSAVLNTAENFVKHRLPNAQAIHSDLFENVEGTFDMIFFNAPFHGNKAMDVLELGTSDYNYQTLRKYFSQAVKYLNTGGTIILGFADMGDNELVKTLAQGAGLQIYDFKTQENGDWTAYLYVFKVNMQA